MVTRSLLSSLLALAAASACEGDSTPPRPTDSTRADAGESTGTAADSGVETDVSNDVPDAQTSRDDSVVPEAGAPIPVTPGQVGELDADMITLVEADAAPPRPAVCERGVFGQLAVAHELPGQAMPLSVTPDGRTWAYAVETAYVSDAGVPADAGTSEAPSMKLELHVANADNDYTLDLPDDCDINLGAALSADGSQLVTARENGLGLTLWELDAEATRFELAATQPFVRLNGLVANGGVRLTHPAFSSSGTRLYVYELLPGGTPLQLVLRDGQWETEQRLTEPAFTSLGFQITGAAADDLTVFGWSSTERRYLAWWRLTLDEPFQESVALEQAVRAVDPECGTWWTLPAVD